MLIDNKIRKLCELKEENVIHHSKTAYFLYCLLKINNFILLNDWVLTEALLSHFFYLV